jgi:hypothetical protein
MVFEQINLTNQIDLVKEYQKSLPELVQEYCSGVIDGVGYLIIIGVILWLLEPVIKKLLDKWVIPDKLKIFISKESIMFLYKWIGLGILIMAFIYLQQTF